MFEISFKTGVWFEMSEVIGKNLPRGRIWILDAGAHIMSSGLIEPEEMLCTIG